MTLDKARELLKTQLAFGSDYNRNAAKLILAEVQCEHWHGRDGSIDQEIRFGKDIQV